MKLLKQSMFLACSAASMCLPGCASAIATISHDVTQPYQIVDPSNLGAKRGTASTTAIGTGFLTLGDASIQSAAQNGGITRISHIDERRTSILGLINTYTIIVYGN